MKMSKLEEKVKKLDSLEDEYLQAISNYLKALGEVINSPARYWIDFKKVDERLAEIHKWIDKKISECLKLKKQETLEIEEKEE